MRDLADSPALESPFLNARPLSSATQTLDQQGEDPLGERETAPAGPRVVVVTGANQPLTDGEYAFHQDAIVERGTLGADGGAAAGKIDLTKPFIFSVRDRVCAIRAGAFFNPDDPRLQYGGTWFDWRLVRDNVNAEKRFWPHYQKEMDQGIRSGVDQFLQHEHVTRRPIQIARPALIQRGTITISATPARIRVGPFVRYADHERAVIWLETVTPAMIKVRLRRSGTTNESARYGTTVRVGGRHFAAVEVDRLEPSTFYDYTIELAPLPPAGPIPIEQQEIAAAFPRLTAATAAAMVAQCTALSRDKSPWLMFRTLQKRYERLRFAYGSCRWYPRDKDPDEKKSWGPDMFEGLGQWLRGTPRDEWPQFLFFGGDQIYADEIGIDHAEWLARARFAARVPGPVDSRGLRDKLVDGAWAGRFAHRFHAYADPQPALENRIRTSLEQLDDLYKQFPDLKDIYREYPDRTRRDALQRRYQTLKNRRELNGAKGEAEDEARARRTLQALAKVDVLEISTEPFRALHGHWRVGARTVPWRNPMSTNFLVHNFLLWSLPEFERHLPTIADRQALTVARTPDNHGHPAAAGGVHAADFAEYSYLYERAWTTSLTVRFMLAHVPTFLMFDDHELTDDWNFDVAWVRMLHNPKDDYRMWPKTLTDALAAYWMYQGWGNKAPSQWDAADPRVAALTDARKAGTDALPDLRRCIHRACYSPVPSRDPAASYQSGTSLDWHYRLPFDPPFLVPDCRTRKLLVPADDKLRIIDHDVASKTPRSQTIDDRQLAWLRRVLVDDWRGGPVAFIAPSTPLLLQKKLMTFMTKPETAAGAWARGSDLAGLTSAVIDSTAAGVASDAVLRVFRSRKDLEHMVRDKSWRDLWTLVDDMQQKGSPVKTLVLVSGDVHHSYSMTANRAHAGRPRPEVVQVTCSGLQTTIRKSFKTSLAEELSSVTFDVGARRLVPGFVVKAGGTTPDLVLYENAVAVVDVATQPEVNVVVTYLAGQEAMKGQDRHVFRYTSGASYMKNGEPAVLANYRASMPRPMQDRSA